MYVLQTWDICVAIFPFYELIKHMEKMTCNEIHIYKKTATHYYGTVPILKLVSQLLI